MKKAVAFIFSIIFVFTLVSCKKSAPEHSETSSTSQPVSTTAKTSAAKDGEATTTTVTVKNYSGVINKLSPERQDFISKLGKTEKNKKIVAFFGDDFETEVKVLVFNKGKVSSA